MSDLSVQADVTTPVDGSPEAVAAAEAALAEQQRLLTAVVGSVRPADSDVARISRLEALLRSQHGIAVLTPEDAVAAAAVQDQAAKDAAAAQAAADEAAGNPPTDAPPSDVPVPETPADAVKTADELSDADAIVHLDAALLRWPDDPDLLAARADLA